MKESKPWYLNAGLLVGGVLGYYLASRFFHSGDLDVGRRGAKAICYLGAIFGGMLGKLVSDIATFGTNEVFRDRETEVDGETLVLKNPPLAAFLAFLIPGAGHLYQGRRRKGWMFMLCVLGTFFFGFVVGGGHVVYASWIKGDVRWHYLCQAPVGLVAMPALVEGNNMRTHTDRNGWTTPDWNPLFSGLMAPPRRPLREDNTDDLAGWYLRRGAGYEMGTWYTMIAGLLNVLVIFDAYAGPLAIPISGKAKAKPPPKESEQQDKE